MIAHIDRVIRHLKNQLAVADQLNSEFVYITKREAEACLELAEAQDAIQPGMEMDARGFFFTCGVCGWRLFHVCDTVHFDDRKHVRYCASCGKRVKWE